MKRISLLLSIFTLFSAATASVLNFDGSSAVAQTSGCGSGSSWYLLRIGTPIAANQFRLACNEHDACYDTYGKSKQECDNAFHNRMLGICARDHNTIVGQPLKIACNGSADAYYVGVRDHAQDAYKKAQAAAPRVGYFDDGGTGFYSNGTSYCGFVSPKHFDFYKQVNQAPTLGRQNPSSFGRNAGVCPLPSGYFDNGTTVFFSAGNKTFCGFPNPQALDSHHRSRPQQPSFGRIDIDPNKFMSYTGVCK